MIQPELSRFIILLILNRFRLTITVVFKMCANIGTFLFIYPNKNRIYQVG